jgi:hypothetical protein
MPTRSGRLPIRRAHRATILASLGVLTLTACGAGATTPTHGDLTSSPAAAGAATSAATAPGAPAGSAPTDYQLHMDFFSQESKQPAVLDPQVFIASPGTAAGTGPQMIPHAANVVPTPKAGPADTPLLGADGSALNTTRGAWEKAAGTVAFACANGNKQATSTLTGLIPGATYSTFVVHLDVQGPGRFTPWGDAAGTTNNFTADTTGAAAPTNTVPGCTTTHEAIVIIWHSDGKTHGATPGQIGVTWHNSLITSVP